MQRRIYCLGTTCAGKTWLMERAQQYHPDIFGLVEVGKIFRQRYSPEHFKGSAAPAHCEQEAIDIFEEEMAKNAHMPVVLVSGQPRRLSQIEATVGKYPGTCLVCYTEESELRSRAMSRGTKADIDLSLARIDNDRIQLYDVMCHLIERQVPLQIVRSDQMLLWISEMVMSLTAADM